MSDVEEHRWVINYFFFLLNLKPLFIITGLFCFAEDERSKESLSLCINLCELFCERWPLNESWQVKHLDTSRAEPMAKFQTHQPITTSPCTLYALVENNSSKQKEVSEHDHIKPATTASKLFSPCVFKCSPGTSSSSSSTVAIGAFPSTAVEGGKRCEQNEEHGSGKKQLLKNRSRIFKQVCINTFINLQCL